MTSQHHIHPPFDPKWEDALRPMVGLQSVGVFGGTFDPVHTGHLLLAECACDQLGLDAVLFVPAKKPPHKQQGVSISPAKDRLAMRSLTGPKAPEKEADPIIVHPAVRNMLLTQKAFAEGGRALVYLLAQYADVVEKGETEEERKFADNILSVLTPIAKAFLTETGYESANHGVQVFGGHGFISEHGMEQIVRDTRIACLYEGTTEIQALDLLGRKVLQTQGAMLKDFTKIIHKFVEANKDNAAMQEFLAPLAAANKEWGDITMQIGMRAMQNPDEVGAAAVDYMYFSGYVTLAFLWARMALVAQEKLAEGTTEVDFYNAKVATARFYFKKILPRIRSHVDVLSTGVAPLFELDAEHFAF